MRGEHHEQPDPGGAYERLHLTGPEFGGDEEGNNGLSNHGPMAMEVLVRRGHELDVPRWVDAYVPRLEELPRGSARITDENWRDALGDGRRIGDWTEFFTRQVAERPWREVLATWWPRLLHGIAAGATHGVIRVGHAVRTLLTGDECPAAVTELAHGLAFWAGRLRSLPGAAAPAGGLDAAAALEALPQSTPRRCGTSPTRMAARCCWCTRRPRRTPCCTRCPPCHASCGRRACRPSGRPAPLPAYLPSTDCAISSMSLGQPDPHTRHFRSYRSLQRSIQIEGTATERHRVRPERGGVLAARNHPRCRWTGRPSSNTRTVVHIALAQNHRPRWLRTRGGAVSAPEATGLWPTVRMDSSHSRLTRLCGRCAWTSANPAPRSPDPRSQADAVAVEPPFSNSRVSLG